jgi:hypothetical protein
VGRNLAGPQGLSRSCAHGVVQSKTTIGNAGILGGTASVAVRLLSFASAHNGGKSRTGQSPSLPDKRRNEARRCGSFLGAEAQKIEDEHDDEDDSLISGSGLSDR